MSTISSGNTTTTALIYTADTTGNLVFTTGGANTVALTLSNIQAATFANNVTVAGSITATGGIIQGANAAPTFSAYQSTLQSIPNATFTKALFQTELWDTNNNFASSTFTPTVAGYYQINGAVQFAVAIAGIQVLAIYKNNSVFVRGPLLNTSASYGSAVSGLVYANGTTDYFELFIYQANGGAVNTDASSATTWFQAALVRSA